MKLLCFGDSNTYGYDPRSYFGGRYDAADRWPDLLTGYTVINAGENGREIPRYPYFPREADWVIVMLGTNDLLQGASAAEAAARMERFLTPLLPRVLLIAPPPMKRGAWVPSDALVEESSHLAAQYRSLSEKLGIPFADTRNWDIELCFDGVHFAEAGHHIFAAKLQKVLDSHLTS